MSMKKVLICLLSLLIISFIVISLIVKNDKDYVNDLEYLIIENTDIKDIEYVNYYDEYYIIRDNVYLYLLNNKFEEIVNVDLKKLFSQYNKYDIVYRDKTIMFMDSYKNNGELVFKYYDIYTGEVIDTIILD